MSKQQRIQIDMTESDLYELIDGKSFEWEFPDESGKLIEVYLYNSDMEGKDE